MNHEEIRNKYGKDRMRCIHYFLSKLNRYYGFQNNDDNLHDFAVSLEKFTNADLNNALKTLEDRESTAMLKFNEIKRACYSAKSEREARENVIQFTERSDKAIPMPEKLKDMIKRITDVD